MVLDLSRFGPKISKAQYELDEMVMDSMIPFMPKQTGTFINVTKAMSSSYAGTGKVIAAAPPIGRFLYEGKTMVDEVTGSPWARRGARKVLVSQYAGKTNARENLSFAQSTNPNATDHWFDAAKKRDIPQWVKKVKKTAGGNT